MNFKQQLIGKIKNEVYLFEIHKMGGHINCKIL